MCLLCSSSARKMSAASTAPLHSHQLSLRVLATVLGEEKRYQPLYNYAKLVQRNQNVPAWRSQVVHWLREVAAGEVILPILWSWRVSLQLQASRPFANFTCARWCCAEKLTPSMQLVSVRCECMLKLLGDGFFHSLDRMHPR